MSDAERLSRLVEVWWGAVHDLVALLEQVPDHQWGAETDLAGWNVHAVAAHIAHLESLLAGTAHEQVDIGEPPHVRGVMGQFTEQGVVARRDRTPEQLIEEVRTSAAARHDQLLAEPPTDGQAPAPSPFDLLGWSTETLLRNRPLDVWMHEQDVRRAIGRPGNLDSPAAVHTADYLAESLGYVLGKRVGAAPGTSLVVEVAGHRSFAFAVADNGRGEPLSTPPAEPTVRIATDRETFILLAGGRRTPAEGAVRISGDVAVGQQVVDRLAVTP